MGNNHGKRVRMAQSAAIAGMPASRAIQSPGAAKGLSRNAKPSIVNPQKPSPGNTAGKQQPAAKEFKLHELTMLSITPIFRTIHRWWLTRAEHHYLICADVEEQRVREAQLNVAYYQRRAALARSARL